ncbi:MAG TPA: hypothetical protein DCO72_05740, partial [Ruminococcus sp.]|nr:hypothetical protein [Ruminococcus sp.]
MNKKRIAAGALAFVLVFGIGAPVLEQTGVLTSDFSVSAADADVKVGWKPTRYYQDAEGNYTFQYVQAGYMQIISLDNDELTEFEVPSEITDEKSGLTFPVEVIYKEAFQGKKNLKKVTIPSTVNRIGVNAFSNCTALEEVVGMEGVTTISDDAFVSCESLKTITLPQGLTNLGNEAFSHCSALTELTIPGSVTLMGSYVASGCPELKSITFEEGITNIPSFFAYLDSNLEKVSIPSTCKSIGMGAFSYSGLVAIEIPDNVTRVDNEVFNNCKRLTSVKLSSGCDIVNMNTFSDCSALEEVIIPDSIKIISNTAFSFCTA